MKKAAMVVGDKVWTMTYEVLKNDKINITDFNCEDPDGYVLPPNMIGRLQSIEESEGRVAEFVTINDERREVSNKMNVYTYRQPLGT